MSRRGQILFFIPAFTLFVIFVLVPSTLTLIESFYPQRGDEREWVGGIFYSFALSDAEFHRSLSNNLVYLLLTLIFEVVVGLALAVGLQREGRLNNFLRVAFFSPNVLSLVIVGLVFGFLFKDGVGVWPGQLREGRALVTISVVSGWAYCGFYMIIFLGGLAGIPKEVLEAARIDGAGPWETFWRIKLPLLKDVIWVALLICFTGAFKAFDLFWVMLPNQDHTSIISTLLVKEFIRFDNPGYGATLAVLLTLLVFATAGVVFGVQSVFRERGTR